jgi:hypothetical protein
MNAELREAVERMDAAFTMSGVIARGDDWMLVAKALRDQEAEIARLREERWQVVATRNAAVDRAEKAEALLREAASFLSIHHPVGPNTIARITAHLGGENNG